MDLFSRAFYDASTLSNTPINQQFWKLVSTDRNLNSSLTGNSGYLFCVGSITGTDGSNLSAQIQTTRGYQSNNVIFDNYGNLLVQKPLIQFTNPIYNNPIPVVLGVFSPNSSTTYSISVAEPLPLSFDLSNQFLSTYNYVANPAWITSPSKRWILAQDMVDLNKGIYTYNILYNPIHNAGFNDFYQNQTTISANGGNAVVDTYIKKYCETSAQKNSADGSRNYGDTTCNCIASLGDCINQNVGSKVDFSSQAGKTIQSAIGYSCVCPTVSSCQHVSNNNQDTFVRSWSQNVIRQLPNSNQDPSSKKWNCPSNSVSFCISNIQSGNNVNLDGTQIVQQCGVNVGGSTPAPIPTVAPIVVPTNAPVVVPTNAPIVVPTNAPIVVPTNLTNTQLYIGYSIGGLILLTMIILFIRYKYSVGNE